MLQRIISHGAAPVPAKSSRHVLISIWGEFSLIEISDCALRVQPIFVKSLNFMIQGASWLRGLCYPVKVSVGAMPVQQNNQQQGGRMMQLALQSLLFLNKINAHTKRSNFFKKRSFFWPITIKTWTALWLKTEIRPHLQCQRQGRSDLVTD